MTSSVTDVFLRVENWYKAPVKILASLFRTGEGHGLFGLILAAPLELNKLIDK